MEVNGQLHTDGETSSDTHRLGACVGPTAGWKRWRKEKIPCKIPAEDDTQVVQPVTYSLY